MVNAVSTLPSVLEPTPICDEVRLRAVVDAHFDVTWRFLRRLGVPERDLDDAVQEVILVLARKLESVDADRERAFVLSTAYRVASTFRRTLRRRREAEPDPIESLADERGTPESLLEQRRARALLDSILERLSPEFRAVFVLYELERLTMAEIADMLQVPPGTVASRLRRARAQFESHLALLGSELAGDAP